MAGELLGPINDLGYHKVIMSCPLVHIFP